MDDERALPGPSVAHENLAADGSNGRGGAISVDRLLKNPDAMLTRTHLEQLGYKRRAIDSIFLNVPEVVLIKGYRRPMIRVKVYLAFISASTYDGSRVR